MVLVLNTNVAILMVCMIGFLSGKMELCSKLATHNKTIYSDYLCSVVIEERVFEPSHFFMRDYPLPN
jgi:hypothetical protein